MGDVQVTDYPQLLPQKCSNCGFGEPGKRKFIDFGLDLEWYGTVYFCDKCFLQIYNAVKNGDVPFASSLFEERDMYRQEVLNMSEKIVALEEEVNELRAAESNRSTVSRDPISVVRDNKEAASSGVRDESDNKSTDRDKPVAKQTTKSGRSDIPSLTELLNAGKSTTSNPDSSSSE